MADTLPARPEPPLPIAISDCLLGNQVRYDGSSARSSFPHTLLDGLFEYRGICPEVGIGMGTPRDPIRLLGSVESPRVVGVKDPGLDVTEALTAFGTATAGHLDDVVGYVFMKNSPSCGLFRVKVYPTDGAGMAGRSGRGAHAAAIVASLPNLPVEENGRLNDPVLRENFVTRTFTYGHWQACFKQSGQDSRPVTAARLIDFHSRYKYLLMAHSIPHYQQAGRLLSDLSDRLAEKAARYIGVLMSGLAVPATAKGHANVLSHLQGYFKKQLDAPSRRELDGLISSYRRGEQPLLAPLTLLKHHLSRYPDEYLAHQVYLDPHPGYAGLRRLL